MIEQAQPPVPHICSLESLVQMAETPDDAVANVGTRSVDQKCGNVEDMEEALQPYRVLLLEAEHADPKSPV